MEETRNIPSKQIYVATKEYKLQMDDELRQLQGDQERHSDNEKILNHIESIQQLVDKLDGELTVLKKEMEGSSDDDKRRNIKLGEKAMQM